MTTKIRDIVQSVWPISEQAMKKIESLANVEIVEKGYDLVKVNQRNNLEYFVLDGICKTYLNSPIGEEITLSFFMTNSIISPHGTRSKDGKSILNIRALTQLHFASLDAVQFENLMIEDLEIRMFANRVLGIELNQKVEKEIGMASLTAKERLEILRKKHPNLENFVPHTDIASYLGITNVSLSRLRKDQ
jgi:CRP-like cAMP-binding protein